MEYVQSVQSEMDDAEISFPQGQHWRGTRGSLATVEGDRHKFGP